jgi:hypothetical protein
MNKFLAIIFSITISAHTYASAVSYGRIVEIKGSGFISTNGKTHEMKKGEIIYVDSEIVVEHSGQVTFTDNADHRFHMGNATSVFVTNGAVELRNGDLWVQSLNKIDDSKLTTANAAVNFTGGEAILSYDSIKGRSQLMVINGLMKLSNLRASELNLTVGEGNFSFVDLKFEEGMPRDPTPVGLKTYGQLVSVFKSVAPMDPHSTEIFKNNDQMVKVTRGIASVAVSEGHSKSQDLEADYKNSMLEIKSKSSNKIKITDHRSQVSKPGKLIVKIYGQVGSVASATTAIYDTSHRASSRGPASVLDTSVPVDIEMNNTPYKTQQNKESERLIQELNKL